MKITQVNIISLQDWDNLVKETYGRPYSFQQQNGCRDRGTFYFSVPELKWTEDDEMNDSIPEIVNGNEMGVKFAVWLSRDPNQPLANQKNKWELNLWWERNFYPDIYTLANDLHEKGLLPADDYVIDIDW